MVQSQTVFRVCDNSGAKCVRCIKVLGGFRRRFACVGDLIVVSIRSVKQHKKKKIKIKEGDVAYALVVHTRFGFVRRNLSKFCCIENSVVLLTNKKKPIASRIIGSIPREIRYSKFMKVASLCSGFV